MPEWLTDSFANDEQLSLTALAVRLAASFVLGCVVAAVYRLAQSRPDARSPGLATTLVLLTLLICMVTMVIGNSVARAFSLVGALAIVRFRTVVEDTRDTAFVILAVAVGMAMGAGVWTVPLLGLPFAALAAFMFRPAETAATAPAERYTLGVRVGVGVDPEAILRAPFDQYLARRRLSATETVRQGAAIELTYDVELRRDDDALALVSQLNRIEGLQNVVLRRA